MKKLLGVVATSVALCALLMPSVSQADTLIVPKSPWPVCSNTQTTWCVSAVSIKVPGGSTQNLTWVAAGAPTTTTTSSTTTTLPQASGGLAPTAEGQTQFPGYWTSSSWPDSSLGFGGLYVEAEAANEFSNYMLFSVYPAIQDSTSGNVYIADQDGSQYPASLSPDDVISVSIETGNAESGVAMAIANNFSDSVGTDTYGTTLTFSATPVPVGVASSTSQCQDETGVAAADVTQLQVIVAPTNDPASGFGVDGVSGKMYVESNGACELSTPVWDSSNETLEWTVAAPHFLANGGVDQGFYQAMIPGSDAALLWGLTNVNAAATALQVSETSSSETAKSVVVSSISVKNGNIIVSSTGFDFSKPTFTLKKNPKYKGTAFKKTTILCRHGASVKHVTGARPVCPKGYTKEA